MTKCSIPISELKFFHSLVKAYLRGSEDLKELYSFPPNEEGLIRSMDSKAINFTKREVLSKVVDYNYGSRKWITDIEKKNLANLKEGALCVTTAHQPNLFLGPLYTLTKAISTIALTNQLNKIQSKRQIVPVFIIGSEDHDKEELLNVTLFGKRYEWATNQKGSIGGMIMDESLEGILHEFVSKFGDSDHAVQLRAIYLESYQRGTTLAQGYGDVLRRLLGKYGLIVLDINLPEVKAEMKSVFHEEIANGFSLKSTEETIRFLSNNYHVQAMPSEINLFEFREGERVKIKKKTADLIEKVEAKPEAFSPSVILRPLMQQMIIPSIANIGGGAEVAYWLELKNIFDAKEIDFPALVLRDIYSVLDEKSWSKWTESGLNERDFFLSIDEINRKLVLSGNDLETSEKLNIADLKSFFSNLEMQISKVDKTLVASVLAEKAKSIKSVETIYEKAVRSLKRSDESRLSSIEKIKNKVFSDQSLTERIENFSSSYILYGDHWIEDMIQSHNPLKAEWTLDLR